MRLIDGDRLIKVIEKAQFEGSGNIMSIINDAPTVDTTFKEVVAYECGQKSVERPIGHWIEFKGGYYKCDKCGEVERAKKNFCSRCGADMRGGKE